MLDAILVVVLASVAAATVPSSEFAFKEGYSLEERGLSMRGSAALRVAGHSFKAGDKIHFEIRFTNNGGTGRVFNPFFVALLRFPAALAVFDSEKRYVGNYLAFPVRSQAGIGPSSWVEIPTDGTIGTTFWRPAAHVPGTPSEDRIKPLPAGRYYVQMIFYNAFIGKDVHRGRMYGPTDGEVMAENFDTSELFRSNIVEVEFVD